MGHHVHMRSRNAWLKPAISYRQLTNRFDKKMAIRTYIHTAAILPTAHGSVDPTGLCASMGLPRSRPGPHCLSKTGSREAKPGTSVLHIQLPLFLVFRSSYSGNFKVNTTWASLGLSGPLWASLGLSEPLVPPLSAHPYIHTYIHIYIHTYIERLSLST